MRKSIAPRGASLFGCIHRSDQALRPLAGTYLNDVPSQPFEILFWVEGKTLMSQAEGQDRIPLRPAGPHAFDWSVRNTFNSKRRGDRPDVRAKRLDVQRTAEALTAIY